MCFHENISFSGTRQFFFSFTFKMIKFFCCLYVVIKGGKKKKMSQIGFSILLNHFLIKFYQNIIYCTCLNIHKVYQRCMVLVHQKTVCLVLSSAAEGSRILCQRREIAFLCPLEHLCLLTEGMFLGCSIEQIERNLYNTRSCSMASDPRTPKARINLN